MWLEWDKGQGCWYPNNEQVQPCSQAQGMISACIAYDASSNGQVDVAEGGADVSLTKAAFIVDKN